jgi:hypothetical protein
MRGVWSSRSGETVARRSLARIHRLYMQLGQRCGCSTGTNLWATLTITAGLAREELNIGPYPEALHDPANLPGLAKEKLKQSSNCILSVIMACIPTVGALA